MDCSFDPVRVLVGISWNPMLSPPGPFVKRTMKRQQMWGLLMLHVWRDREKTW